MKKHIPNAITCCNLICGCIATYYAFQSNYHLSLAFIILGAVFDFFDGMSARLLHVSSPIGKELDSLADCITFGFAPSAMIFSFLETYHDFPAFVPFLSFIMAAFSALRLAKFNLDERQSLGFIGLPTPANALFWGSLISWLGFRLMFEPYALPTYIYIVVLVMVPVSSLLLVAELPLFALKFKQWGWRGNEVKYVYLITAAAIILLLGTLGIAVAIAWYVVLNILFNSRRHLC